MTAPEEPGTGPVIRDNRRIDPVTGQPRRGKHAASQPAGTSGAGRPGAPGSARQRDGEAAARVPADEASPAESAAAPAPAPAAAPKAAPADPAASQLQHQLGERTADLQRLQAEYVNYRRRVERDREAVREQALANVLTNLLPVLDDIGRAREHGELEGGFKSVGEALEAIVEKLGLQRFGEPGDPFDPNVHEALMHQHSPDVEVPTAAQILQPGYRIGDRVVRPARVAVVDPDAG
jgi:molecular chaperone GrpE